MTPARPATYRPASRFVVRTPLLPFAAIEVASATDAARAALRARLADPAIREAVYVASPDLDRRIDEWIASAGSPEGLAIERALVRYVSRMAGRATPFGLFSGVSVGTIGPATRLELAAREDYRRHTRLDGDYLFSACAALSRDPAIAADLRFRPSSSLYHAAGRLHYAEARAAGGARSYHLVAIHPTDYLDAVLDRARDGATLAELATVLLVDPEVTADDASVFLGELVETQVLVSELQPAVTGAEPTGRLIAQLAGCPAAAPAVAALTEAATRLAALDATPPGTPPATYAAVTAGLVAGVPVPIEHGHVVQVDLTKPAPGATLGTRVTDELGRAIELLARIGPAEDEDVFAEFRRAFVTRYETREVPLVEVLDAEIGLGFGDDDGRGEAPLLAGLVFPATGEPRRVAAGPREAHLMALAAEATRTGASELVLSDRDVERLARPTPVRLADSLSVTAVVAAASSAAVDAGDFTVRVSGIGGGGVRMLGRFCHGSPEVEALTREVIAHEQALRPEVIQAEIVHLPEGRIGNILLRPVLRPYEIVFLGASGADPDHQLPVTDLLVSVAGDRVILRSRRLGRAILPRLTTAHNYSARSLGVYRFLCSVAGQYGSGTGWSWGVLADQPFLPRVRRGRIVLSRARWLLRASDLEPLVAASKGSKAARTPDQLDALRERQAGAVAGIRAARRLPRWIVVSDGDNELPVDLDNPLMVDSFVHLVKDRSTAVVSELFPAPDQLCVTGPEGGFVHELIVPFVRVADQVAAVPPPRRPRLAAVRRFPPGSPWVFWKLYTGTATADRVLREVIAPVVDAARADGLADGWFFLRYSDPDPHLRVRFAGDPARLFRELVPRVHAALSPAIDAGLVWRVVIDTYEREIERYGGAAAIGIAERLFAADSDAVLAIVATCEGDEGADAAWRLTLRGMDRMLDDLGLTLAERLVVATAMRDELGAEHHIDTAFQRRLGDKFRTHRAEIAELLAAPDDDPAHPLAPGLAALAARSAAIRPLAAELVALRAAGQLDRTIPELARSYIHMHVNRMLASAQRAQEMVLYDLLRRHYDGVIARARPR